MRRLGAASTSTCACRRAGGKASRATSFTASSAMRTSGRVRLPARNRQQRDHRRRARPPRVDAAGKRRDPRCRSTPAGFSASVCSLTTMRSVQAPSWTGATIAGTSPNTASPTRQRAHESAQPARRRAALIKRERDTVDRRRHEVSIATAGKTPPRPKPTRRSATPRTRSREPWPTTSASSSTSCCHACATSRRPKRSTNAHPRIGRPQTRPAKASAPTTRGSPPVIASEGGRFY